MTTDDRARNGSLDTESDKNRPEETSLGQSIRAFNWSAAGYASGSLLRFLIGVVLARLLGPEPFGQVAVALLAIGMGNMLSEFGLGTVLIHRDVLERQLVQSVFTLQSLIGALNATLWWIYSPSLAAFLNVEDATAPIRLLSLAFLLSSLGQASGAVLRRQLRVKRLQLIQIGSYFAGYAGVGIPLAVMGAGVWSLVVAQTLQSLLNSVSMFLSVRHEVSPRLDAVGKDSIVMGARVAGSSLIDWVITNMDTIIVGRVFGPVSLGLYNRSYFSAYTPANIVAASLRTVLLPVMSRFGHDKRRIEKSFLSLFGFGSFVLVATFGTLAAVSETFVLGVYGNDWIGAAGLLQPLALSMIPLVLISVTSSTLWAIGEMERELQFQMVAGALALIVFLSMATISVTALAWGVTIVYVTRLTLMSLLVSRSLDLGVIVLSRSFLRSGFLGLLVSTVVLICDHCLKQAEIGALFALVVDISLGGVLVLLVLVVKPSLFGDAYISGSAIRS